MKSIRIEAIASLIDKDAYILDIGTDHAYLPIYLYNNHITNKIIASDISDKVLESSFNNLKKYSLDKNILLIKSDGFTNINYDIDTAVIAGMGASTIIRIIENASKLPNTIIISSHNDQELIRKYMNSINYKIDKEIVIKDNNIYYVIIKYIKGNEILTDEEILFGKSNNKEYLNYLLNYYQDLYNKSHKIIYKEYVLTIEKKLSLMSVSH